MSSTPAAAPRDLRRKMGGVLLVRELLKGAELKAYLAVVVKTVLVPFWGR